MHVTLLLAFNLYLLANYLGFSSFDKCHNLHRFDEAYRWPADRLQWVVVIERSQSFS